MLVDAEEYSETAALEILAATPPLEEGDMFYWMAFGHLTKTRDTSMSVGSIRFDSIMSYGRMYDLSRDETESLIDIVIAMDDLFLKASRTKSGSGG